MTGSAKGKNHSGVWRNPCTGFLKPFSYSKEMYVSVLFSLAVINAVIYCAVSAKGSPLEI